MSRSIVAAAGAAAFCVGMLAGVARAQDKSQYTLFAPAPREQMRPFNTDRPTKSNVPYTVDAGHFQYEGDVFIYSFDNTTTPGTDNTSWVLFNPTFKLGLTNQADFEVNFNAQTLLRSQSRSDGATTAANGFGDTVTRMKVNLWGNDAGSTAMALIPFAKWPTAPAGVGNRFVEGGVSAPLAIALPAGFTAIVMGEMDYLKNPNDNGYHVNFPALINLNRPIFENVTAYAEIYANWSTRQDVRDIYTLDLALAWTPLPNFQIDIGINIGLVSAATPYQIYMGIAQRF
jgi:hypothetical protein